MTKSERVKLSNLMERALARIWEAHECVEQTQYYVGGEYDDQASDSAKIAIKKLEMVTATLKKRFP